MSRLLNFYREDGFFLRIKNLVLTDYYIGEHADLYLALKFVDGHEHESSYFERFDIRLDEFVLKIRNDSIDKQHAIVKAFERYLSELSPATILINKANYLEIDDHNESDYDEGWMSYFGNFDFTSFELYSNSNLEGSHYRRAATFHACGAMLRELSELPITITNERQLFHLQLRRLIRLLKLCVSESIRETLALLNGYYLQRGDAEMMRTMYGAEFEMACKKAMDLSGLLGSIDQNTD